ncbi:MAG TPA: hypothetical protein ENK55_07705 [Actinobacteria bacterium]|nr:hypothetical protein [Actinomycetota bacterium]
MPRDAAFDPDDPDAASAPLRSIRYPGEAAIWRGVAAELPETVEPSPRLLGAAAARPRPDPAVSDSIVRLFCALFDRRPDDFELTYWVARYRAGLPLVTIAEAFVGADEYLARRGSDAVEDVVAGLYLDALGRTPPPDAVAALARRVRDGETSLGSVIVSFTESPTYVARTATASPRKPPLPYPAVGSGKRILYSDSEQRVWLVSDTGELVKTHLVSGRRGVPGVGRYRVYSKSRYAWAPYDGITMEYMVRFARGEWPYGFHSIPIYPDRRPLQTKAQLGTHRSGGCVRQDWEDAEFLFRWAEIGTRVIVVP